MPPPGWQPDPTWPTPAPSHKFWRRTRAGKVRLARNISLFIVVPILLLTACWAVLAVLPPLDLPPGDMQTLRIDNNTSRAVVIFDCADVTCVSGISAEEIAAGGHSYDVEDAYTPGPIGAADPVTHRLVGCLVRLPHADRTGEYPANETVEMSTLVGCPGMTDPAPKVHFYNP
jgi:hypothetical protein